MLFRSCIDQRIEAIFQSETSGRNQSILVWGNRIIASIVFRLLGFSQLSKKAGFDLSQLTTNPDFLTLVTSTAAALISHVASDYSGSYIAMLFRNPSKSRDLYGKTCDTVMVNLADMLERLKQSE